MSKIKCIQYEGQRHPLYNVLKGMKTRCYNPNCINYKFYGKKGITIAEEWMNSTHEFVKWGIANGWKKGLCIDRIKTKKKFRGYSLENCRFVTYRRNNNNRIDNRFFHYDNKKYNVSNLCKKFDITIKVFDKQIELGYTVKQAIKRSQEIKKLRLEKNCTYMSQSNVLIKGREYSLSYICKKYSLDRDAFFRLKQRTDLTDKQIIKRLIKEKKERDNNYQTFLYQGQKRSINEIAKLNDIDHNTIRRHLSNGKNIKQAIKAALDVKGSREPKYLLDGKYVYLRQICNQFNVARTTLKRKLNKELSLKKAIKAAQQARRILKW